MDRPTLVIYHGGCQDGFCAAWVAARHVPHATFYPAQYGEPSGDRFPLHLVDAHTDVYVLDFSYARAVLDEVARHAQQLVLLDHHQGVFADFDGADYATLDNQRSGAQLAWDHFDPDTPRPWLVDYVADRDLWRHALPDSHVVNAYLGTLPHVFATWTATEAMPWEDVMLRGFGARDYQVAFVDEVIRAGVREMVVEAFTGRFPELFVPARYRGGLVPVVNTPFKACSEVGNVLLARYPRAPFSVTWRVTSAGAVSFSLRARPGETDVSAIARLHGGNGHKAAAGFRGPLLPGLVSES